jgi:serine/threonine protein kinase
MKSCPICQAVYPDTFVVCPQDGSALVGAGVWPEGTMVRGKYRVLSKIGQGGMGSVYKALHVSFDELRALKVMSPELLRDELFVRRFKHEAVITRRLQHPNAVRVDDIDETEDGRPFIVMEYIEGESLKKLIKREGSLPVPRVCSMIKQVAAALDAAHRLGMVHRDIKPDNIVLVRTREGEQAKVLDFGIAKVKESRLGGTGSMTLTGTGVVIGTPQYMSPEQAMGKRGDQLDGRSDLYSLGVVMYEMLAGDLPFKADTSMEMLLAHLMKAPTPIRTLRPELQIPEPVADLVMRLLEKKAELRPATGQALIAEIERVEKGMVAPAATRVAEAGGLYSPSAAEALQAALRATSPARPSSGPPPVTPAPVTPAPQARPASVARPGVAPAAQLRVVPAPPAPRSSQWGIWVSMGILVVGLGGGGWYYVAHRPPPPSKPPAETTSPPGVPGKTTVPENPPDSTGGTEGRGGQANGVSEGRTTPTSSSREATTRRKAGSTSSQPPPRAQPPTPVVDLKKVTAAIKMGDFYFDRGEYENAINEYQQGLNADPTNRELNSRLVRARRAKSAEERLNQ